MKNHRKVLTNQDKVLERTIDSKTPGPVDAAAKSLSKEAVKAAVSKLPYREREILKLLYGFDDQYHYSFKEVAKIFKVDRERVVAVHDEAMANLSQNIREDLRRFGVLPDME